MYKMFLSIVVLVFSLSSCSGVNFTKPKPEPERQSIFGGPTLPCDWIEVHGRTAHLKNEPVNLVVGSDFQFKD